MNYNKEEFNLKKDIAKVVMKMRHVLGEDSKNLTDFYLWQMKEIKSVEVNQFIFSVNDVHYIVDITPENESLDHYHIKETEKV